MYIFGINILFFVGILAIAGLAFLLVSHTKKSHLQEEEKHKKFMNERLAFSLIQKYFFAQGVPFEFDSEFYTFWGKSGHLSSGAYLLIRKEYREQHYSCYLENNKIPFELHRLLCSKFDPRGFSYSVEKFRVVDDLDMSFFTNVSSAWDLAENLHKTMLAYESVIKDAEDTIKEFLDETSRHEKAAGLLKKKFESIADFVVQSHQSA